VTTVIIDTENLTVIRLTEPEVDTLKEIIDFLSPEGKQPKLLSNSQENLVEDLKYNL
jgi:hypothetical protein